MNHKLLSILLLILILQFDAKSQCSGGVANGTIVPTLVWQSTGTNPIAGNRYKNFVAAAGNTYYFSFCIADGGNSAYDTQISILTNTGVNVAGAFNDDNCGLQSYLSWTCVTAGTYRVLITKYNCANQANLGTMVYKYSAPLTCPSNLGTGVTTVAALPYSSGAGTTCGAVNDITASNCVVCGSTFYYGGEDKIWKFTPAITGSVTITLTAAAATYTGLMLYKGCPLNGQGGTCVDYNQSSTGSKTLTVCLQAGVTYYLILDSWPAPACNPYTNLTISAPVAAGGCNLGTGAVNITLPYTSTGRTTCGKVDDLTSTNTVTCGSTSYFTGEDEVFVFTPTVTGNSTITLTSGSTWVGLMLYDGCPMVSSCNITPGSCVATAQSPDGNQSMCVNLTSGHTYYLVVDQFASPTCIPSYNINITAPTGLQPGATCASPVVLSSLPFSANNETTSCMGNDYSNATTGSCGSLYESGSDKVYKYTATATECISITLNQASSNYIGYQVYNGCPGSGGTCIGSNGGATSGALSGSITLPAAGTYYIIIDSWSPPSEVTYDISIQSNGSGASNDLPCNAVSVPIGVYMNGSNNCSGGASEPAAPACWLTPNTVNSVWFSFVAPSSQVTIRTSPGSLHNSQIAVYSGTCGATMTLVDCNDDAPSCGSTINYMSQLNLTTLNAGSTYFISVDGYANLTGSFGLIVIDGAPSGLPPISGQECALPNPVCNQNITVGSPGYQAFGSTCDFPGGGTNCLLSGERGSAFYQIQIASNGILSFDIVPLDYPGALAGDETDYDFALWKMKDGSTGIVVNSCASIAAGAAPIRCNYSYLGVTGCNSTTVNTAPAAYAPDFNPAYDSQVSVSAGDIYLLVVSNFENSTSGFNMNFGSASPINYTPNPGYVIWSGGIDNDWFKPANWGGCAIPNCTIDALIPPSSANMPFIGAAGANCKSLTINQSASLTIGSGFTLAVCGDYNNNGSLIAQTNSTVLFNNGNIVQNMNGNMVGASAFFNVTVTKTGGLVNMNQNADMRGTFTISNATSSFNATGKYHHVAGHFMNYGTYTSGTGGTLELFGTTAQNYQNSGTINNLTMNHTGTGVTLLTNATLGNLGTLTLTSGKIITTAAYQTIVNNRAPAACTTGNISSYVEGFLRRYINPTGSYDFPVGHSAKGYERANLNFAYGANPTSIDNLVSSFDPYPTLPTGIPKTECGVTYSSPALNNGRWTFVASNSPTSGNFDATLYNLNYSNVSSGWTVMKNPSSLGWDLYNGTCVASPITAVKRLNMNGFGTTGTALLGTIQAPTPLPVELLSFNAIPLTNSILTQWSTANEQGSSHFELERSITSSNFVKLATIPSKGTSYSVTNYQFIDKTAEFNQTYFYRLKEVDINGDFKYSEITSTKLNADGSAFTVSPNPFTVSTVIGYELTEKADVKIEILNNLGQSIKLLFNESQNKGGYKFTIDAKEISLQSGIYTIRMTIGNQLFTKLVLMN